ncbi:MAG: glutamate--tRNA ligase, partial [Pseudomonadota bacterium]
MVQQIITRFAPSPTGYLHIGGARTALFNWLYARGAQAGPGSKFLLRIEDTDRARHNEAAVNAIIDGLTWLGLDWDDEPISQFARSDRHREVAETLLDQGLAYRCWLAGEALDQARAQAREQNIRFTSPWRDYSGPTPNGPYALRLKAPTDGDTKVQDHVQGEVCFPNRALDDMILLRADGTPTYMLAVVVDDHDMGITHVIRGDDHLINAARQSHLFEAMGWETPDFAHMPLIHGEDGKKLSKRHGALGVDAYRDEGFLAEGRMNGLLKLG